MAQVTVSINERDYQVGCDDGQEAHVFRLGVYIDKRVGELVAAVGNVGDANQVCVPANTVTWKQLLQY